MNIDFSLERWSKVRETYKLWWEGKLNRPIIPVELTGRDPGRKMPEVPVLTQATCSDFSFSAKQIVDRLDYELSRKVYVGDAFPFINLDCFGPGVAAAFLGASLDNSTGRVWFHPQKELHIKDMHFEYDPNNIWLKRVKDICYVAVEKWQGMVLVGMPDLGGTLDILSTFRPGEELLYDLYDYQEEVKRITWEIHELWHRFYTEINSMLRPVNPGYSDWSTVYSYKPSYILQCDFSYMISPEMFDEFVRPELEADCRRLDRSIYHLDGKGQIPHLDSLLKIKELSGVQWVPGDGTPDHKHWSELFQKIHAAGKKIQINYGGFDCIDAVTEFIKEPGFIQHSNMSFSIDKVEQIKKKLYKYEIE